MAMCHEICDLVEGSAWSGVRVRVVVWQLKGSPGELCEQGSSTNVGVVVLLLGICAFFSLGGICRAWVRTPFNSHVFCCFVCCGMGFIDPRNGDNRSNQTILCSFAHLLHNGCWDGRHLYR